VQYFAVSRLLLVNDLPTVLLASGLTPQFLEGPKHYQKYWRTWLSNGSTDQPASRLAAI
jgi:hypothetical protein